MAKYMTRSEAATAKDKAAKLMESTGQPDRADQFRRMSLDQYAQHRGATLMDNPRLRRGFMTAETKDELSDKIDEIESLIDEALDAELTREKVIQKIKAMRDVVEGEDDSCAEDEDDLDPDENDDED